MTQIKPTNTVIRWEVRYKVSPDGQTLIFSSSNRQGARDFKTVLKRNFMNSIYQVQMYRVEEQTFRDGSMLALIEKAR